MSHQELVDRLAAHRLLAGVPRAELEWLAAHGTLRTFNTGAIVAQPTIPLDTLVLILTGHVAIHVDRGSGPRKVMEWLAGDVTGILPYSRMTTPPGTSVTLEDTEVFELHVSQFPGLIRECYHVTAACVHAMIDRARHFTSTDLQDEKMQSLGRLSAGLAHELNNPASAITRSAANLGSCLVEADRAARALGAARLNATQAAAIDDLIAAANAAPERNWTPLERSDREEAIAGWLAAHHLNDAAAAALARLPEPTRALERLASLIDDATLAIAVRYLAAESEARAIAGEIERAASRISGLVTAVKRWTYVDQATAPKPVDIGSGLRDTITMLSSKARRKSIVVALDVPADLPAISGFGGELNQVWMNLIDNAIDAAPAAGHVTVRAAHDSRAVSVSVVNDGPAIPDDIRARIFDPFFTTKPPGEGTGLGLDIARRIVFRHEGDLDVASAPGRTEFKVTIPVRA